MRSRAMTPRAGSSRGPRSIGRLRSARSRPTGRHPRPQRSHRPRRPAGGAPQAPGTAPRPPGQALSWRGDGDGHPAPRQTRGTLDAEAHVSRKARLLRKKHTGVWMRLVADQRRTRLSPRRVTTQVQRSGQRETVCARGRRDSPSRPRRASPTLFWMSVLLLKPRVGGRVRSAR